MKFVSAIRAALAATLSIGLLAQPALAEVWLPERLPDSSQELSLTLDDGWRFYGAVSSINKLSAAGEWQEFCEQFEGSCAVTAQTNAVTNRILPLCETASQGNCLEGLSVSVGTSSMAVATALAPVSGYRLNANPELGIPEGTLPQLFAIGDEKYVVNARMVFGIKSGQAKAEDFQVQVWRVVDRSDSTKQPIWFKAPQDGSRGNVEGAWDAQCAVVDQNYCAQIVDFAPGTRVQTTVRVSEQVTGWLKGRLTSPGIESSKLGAFNRYVISGEPVRVPKFSVQLSKSHPMLQNPDGLTGIGGSGGSYYVLRADSRTGINFVKTLAKETKDTAAAIQSVWYAATIGDSWDLNRCNQGKEFVGLVTTNAMAFDGDIPKFAAGFLSYNVAGLHFEPDGKTEVLGSYDLAIKSSVARCLYGYTNAPVSAQITVTGTSGEQKVATTLVREAAGWLTLSAKGFTFSENQVKVKLLQTRTFNTSKFAAKSNVITTKIRNEVIAGYNRLTPSEAVTCVGYFNKSADKALAQRRAAAVCAVLRPRNSALKITATTKQAAALDGRVAVSLR